MLHVVYSRQPESRICIAVGTVLGEIVCGAENINSSVALPCDTAQAYEFLLGGTQADKVTKRRKRRKLNLARSSVARQFEQQVWSLQKHFDDRLTKLLVMEGTALRGMRYAALLASLVEGAILELEKLDLRHSRFSIREAVYEWIGDCMGDKVKTWITSGRKVLSKCGSALRDVETLMSETGSRSIAGQDISDFTSVGESIYGSYCGQSEPDILREAANFKELSEHVEKQIKKYFKPKGVNKALPVLLGGKQWRRRMQRLPPAVIRFANAQEEAEFAQAASISVLRHLYKAIVNLGENSRPFINRDLAPGLADFFRDLILSNLGRTLKENGGCCIGEFQDLVGGNITQLTPFMKAEAHQPLRNHSKLLRCLPDEIREDILFGEYRLRNKNYKDYETVDEFGNDYYGNAKVWSPYRKRNNDAFHGQDDSNIFGDIAPQSPDDWFTDGRSNSSIADKSCGIASNPYSTASGFGSELETSGGGGRVRFSR